MRRRLVPFQWRIFAADCDGKRVGHGGGASSQIKSPFGRRPQRWMGRYGGGVVPVGLGVPSSAGVESWFVAEIITGKMGY